MRENGRNASQFVVLVFVGMVVVYVQERLLFSKPLSRLAGPLPATALEHGAPPDC